MSDETATTGGIIGILTAAFGGILWQQRAQCSNLQAELDAERRDKRDERESCAEQLKLRDARIDSLSDVVAELAERIGEMSLSRRARSITPRDFPAPKLDRPSGEHPAFGKLEDDDA